MNEMQIFNNDEFGEVRTVIIDGEVWFIGNDVARALGYAEPKNAVMKFVDADDKQGHQFDSSGQRREMMVINESGLYSLIFGSRMENAKRFKKWVTSEVLPSIRKTGSYNANGIPHTTAGQIQLLAQGYVELEKKVDGVADNMERVKTDLQSMKEDMPLFPAELEQITRAAKRKGVEVMGGGDSPAYHDRGLCISVYKDIYGEIHRNFGVDSYKLIKRSECGKVIEVISGYRLPMVLAERVANTNMGVVAEE